MNIIPNPRNASWGTEGCKDTPDRVFALSIDEARKLFADDEDMMAAVTPYAKKGGSDVYKKYKLRNGEGPGWWWLRSPGFLSHSAALVLIVGVVYESGDTVDDSAGSVRPALWLNLQSEIFKSI